MTRYNLLQRFTRYVLFIVAALGTTIVPNLAAASGNIGVFATVFNPLDNSQSLQPMLNSTLQAESQNYFAQQGGVCSDILSAIENPKVMPDKGVVFKSDTQCFVKTYGPQQLTITTTSPTSVQIDGAVRGISIHGSVTQPTVLGSYADPCIFFYFDIVSSTPVTINGTTISMGNSKVSVQNMSKIDSCNTAGDIAKLASSMESFFTGSGFLDQAQQAIAHSAFPLATKQTVNLLTQNVQTSINKYATKPTLYNQDGDIAFIFQTKLAPSDFSGKLSGEIHSIQGSGFSIPSCNQLAMKASYETVSAMVINPFAAKPEYQAPPLTSVMAPLTFKSNTPTKISIGGSSEDVCNYTASHLPLGYKTTFVLTNPQGTAYTRAGAPGWGGAVTVSSSSSGEFQLDSFTTGPVQSTAASTADKTGSGAVQYTTSQAYKSTSTASGQKQTVKQ